MQADKSEMAKKISIVDFPEEEKIEGNFGVKIYGETSYENQLAKLKQWLLSHRTEAAIITHYMHNFGTVFADPFRNEALRILGFNNEEEMLAAIRIKKN